METLLETLTQYAEENLVPRYLRENTPQIEKARLRAEHLAEKLGALAPGAEEWVEELEVEWGNIQFCRERAVLLSGISTGLKLGRL